MNADVSPQTQALPDCCKLWQLVLLPTRAPHAL